MQCGKAALPVSSVVLLNCGQLSSLNFCNVKSLGFAKIRWQRMHVQGKHEIIPDGVLNIVDSVLYFFVRGSDESDLQE